MSEKISIILLLYHFRVVGSASGLSFIVLLIFALPTQYTFFKYCCGKGGFSLLPILKRVSYSTLHYRSVYRPGDRCDIIVGICFTQHSLGPIISAGYVSSSTHLKYLYYSYRTRRVFVENDGL